MPKRNDDWAEGLGWSNFQESLFEEVAPNRLLRDDTDAKLFQQAFDVGWFDMDASKAYREAAREYVIDTLAEQYGVDFDEQFDWDAWRENYG